MALLTAVAVKMGWATHMQLNFRYHKVVSDLEIWRVFTSICFFGELGERMLMRLVLYLQHSKLLEESDYLGHPYDYAWILAIASTLIIAMSALISPVSSISTSLSFAVTYLWARRSGNVNVALMGVFEIPASYYPYISFCLNFFFFSSEQDEAIYSLVYGMLAGHFLFFFEDVYPRYDPGTRILSPPWKRFAIVSGGTHHMHVPAEDAANPDVAQRIGHQDGIQVNENLPLRENAPLQELLEEQEMAQEDMPFVEI